MCSTCTEVPPRWISKLPVVGTGLLGLCYTGSWKRWDKPDSKLTSPHPQNLLFAIQAFLLVPYSLKAKFLYAVSFFFFFLIINLFLLVFNLPIYKITPSAHPIKCPLSARHPVIPPSRPTSLSTTPCSFPRVRGLSCSVSLSDISYPFLLPSPLFPFTILYIPQMNENIHCLSFSD